MVLENRAARLQPWTVTGPGGVAGAYYDFVSNPELIREKLEDFKPYEDKPAVQNLYRILEDLNRQSGLLETCDCALGPMKNGATMFGKSHNLGGRLEIIIRDQKVNTELVAVANFIRYLSIYLQKEWPDCDVAWIEIHTLQTKFTALPNDKSAGYRTSIVFQVHGDGTDQVWTNLDLTLSALFKALKRLEQLLIPKGNG